MDIDREAVRSYADDREPPDRRSPAVAESAFGGSARRQSRRRRWADLLARVLADRRVRYLLVGGVSAGTYYLIFTIGWLTVAERVPYLVMALIANVCTAILTYPLYYREVFRHTGPWLTGFLRFYATCLWALTYVLVGLPLLVEVVGMHVLIAQAIIIVTSPLINYQIHRFWAFRQRS